MNQKPRIFNLRGQKVTLSLTHGEDEEHPYLMVQAVQHPDVHVSMEFTFSSESDQKAAFRKYDYKHARQFVKSTGRLFASKPAPAQHPVEEEDYTVYCPVCGGYGGESYGSDDGTCETCGGSGRVDGSIFDEDGEDTEDICDVCGEESHDCECTDEELERGVSIW